MFEIVKQHLKDIIEIADECPEKYQVKCFEILLDSLAKGTTAVPTSQPAPNSETIPGLSGTALSFFSRNSITQEQWASIFHFDGNECSVIVQDLKEKTRAPMQVKLALLLGVKNLLETGTATVPKDELINMCKQYAAFDSSNFAVHMRKPKNLFLQKGTKGWELTQPGQSKASEVIKELAQ